MSDQVQGETRGLAPPVLLRGGTLVTCDAEHRVMRGDLLLRGGRIARLGRRGRTPPGARVIDATDQYVLPGLIMPHVHLCQVLARGMADDLPLLDWLKRRIWPLEAAHDERSLRISAELGLTELLLAGTTCILDVGTVHGHDVVFDACLRSGMRAFGGKSLMDKGAEAPARLRQTTRASLADADGLAERWHRHPSGRIHYVYVPRFILSSSERQVREACERARARGCLIHTHASEHADERRAVRSALGSSDVRVLRRWGAAGRDVSFAHGVQLTRAEMQLLARDGTALVHCPSANLKLGSGVARLRRLIDAGLTVGLGADGAPCNNNLDPWVELRRAALLSSMVAGPGALSAGEALHLLTLRGAQLLGEQAQLGSLEVGKRADVVVLDPRAPHMAPALDPVAALVYSAQARDVRHVLINGAQVVENGVLSTLDAPRLIAEARQEAPRWKRRAGL